MSTTSTLNSYWQYYQQCAADAERGSADALSEGREEQLCEVLRTASPAKCVLTRAERDRFDRLPWNRSKSTFGGSDA